MAEPNDEYRLTAVRSTDDTTDYSADVRFDVLNDHIAGVYAIGDPIVAALTIVAALSVVGDRDRGSVALYWARGDDGCEVSVMAALRDVESLARRAIDSLEGNDPDPERGLFWHDAVDL